MYNAIKTLKNDNLSTKKESLLCLKSVVDEHSSFNIADITMGEELLSFFNSFKRNFNLPFEIVRKGNFFSYLEETYDQNHVVIRLSLIHISEPTRPY